MEELEFLEKSAPIDTLMKSVTDDGAGGLPDLYRSYRQLADLWYELKSENVRNECVTQRLGEIWGEIKDALKDCLYDMQQAEKRWEKI